MTSRARDVFQFGMVTRLGTCCGKPQGCTIDSAGCLYRRLKSDDPRLRCQATAWPDAAKYPDRRLDEMVMVQCVLAKGHDGACDCWPVEGMTPVMLLPEETSRARDVPRHIGHSGEPV